MDYSEERLDKNRRRFFWVGESSITYHTVPGRPLEINHCIFVEKPKWYQFGKILYALKLWWFGVKAIPREWDAEENK